MAQFIGFALVAYGLIEIALATPLSSKRVGGLRFVRIGRLSLSFCICKTRSLQ